MLAEYVPPDFEVQQRKAAEDALAIIVKETGLPPSRVSSTVRQGGIYQEILEEANGIQADLIVMSSHRPQRTRCAPISLAPMPGTWCATPNARCWW